MRKQYFSDCLLQLALLWSLFRIDPNNLAVPNNEILNYPEVQDILQGQTLAYLPTNFHNQYNSLNTNHGYAHPKHADSDIFHSSIFRELRRFRGVSTNIEAFLASNNGTTAFPSLQQGNIPPTGGGSSNSNGQEESVVSSSTAQAEANIDVNHNVVCVDIDLDSPFPGLSLCQEDLDLIEVLWRQDVDLGVTKEVFDPNLRRELQQERQLEALKEQEKSKAAEKRAREEQANAHQWLTDNFVRDGETGEWVPVAGSGPANNNNDNSDYPATTSPSFHPQPVPAGSLSLEEALNYVGELSNHSYVAQPLPHHQLPQPPQAPVFPPANLSSPQAFPLANLSSPQAGEVPEDLQFHSDGLFDETGISNYTHQNHSDTDRIENTWQEVVSYLSDFTNSTDNTTATVSTMPPVEDQVLVTPQAPTTTTASLPQPQLLQQHPNFLQQFNSSGSLGMSVLGGELEQSPSNVSASTSMNETRQLLRQNSTMSEGGLLAGLLGDSAMLLSNATLPLMENSTAALHNALSGIAHSGLMKQDCNATSPGGEDLNSLDWEGGELFFNNITDLDNLTQAMANNPCDLLTSMLPADHLDMDLEGLDTIQMLDDAGSDSAISMGCESPQQEMNETMESSAFDGLEGATGGSDYDASNYGHHRSHTVSHSSTSAEDDGFHYSCSSYGSPASVNTNCSTGSNDTEHSGSLSSASASLNHIHHNHTYPTQPGQTPREVKKYAKKDGPRQKGPHSRDAKRAQDLRLPFTFDHIISSPVEEFNEMVTKTKLTEPQLALMRDIRRRGKNKVAAQNCRKRKLDVLFTLEDEMGDMQRARDKLAAERRLMDAQTRAAKEKYSALYDHIFRSLRDEDGRPYDPQQFSLQQSSDGNVFLVRLNNTSAAAATAVLPSASSSTGGGRRAASSSSASSSSSSSSAPSKRKDFASSSSQQKKKSKE